MVFIQTGSGASYKGVVLSLWDTELIYYAVNVDLLSTISFSQNDKAKELLTLLTKSLPIEGRVKAHDKVRVYTNQIIINTSARDELAFHGKVFIDKTSHPADEKKSLLSLFKPHCPENEMLEKFIHTLELDMRYLVLTHEEHAIDTAIEVLGTICTLANLFTISTAMTSTAGGGGLAAKILANVSSWKANIGLTVALNIFPQLIKSHIADRPEDRRKA